jgi:hypothetical protein
MNCTDEPPGIEKLFQLMSAFWLDWFTTVCVGLEFTIVALPTATVPPVGPPPAIAAVEARTVEPTKPLVASSRPRKIVEPVLFIVLRPRIRK